MDTRRFFSIASPAVSQETPSNLSAHVDEMDRWLGQLARALSRSIAAGRPVADLEPDVLEPPTRLARLGQRLGLTRTERRALALAVAPSYSPRVAMLYGAIIEQDRATELTPEVLGALAGRSAFALRQHHYSLLVEPGALLRMALVGWQRGALVETPALRAMLFDRTGLESGLRAHAELHPGGPPSAPVLDDEAARQLEAARTAWRHDDLVPLTLTVGPRGCGHTLLGRTLAATLGQDLVEVDVASLPAGLDPMVLVREARWLGAVVALRIESVDARATTLVDELLHHQVAVIVSLTEPADAARVWPAALRIDLRRPDIALRRRLWAGALPAWVRGAGLCDAGLAFRFRGTPREIQALATTAVREARLTASGGPGRVTAEIIDCVARRTLVRELGQLGAPCQPLAGGIGRVVLSPAVRAQLDEVVMRVEQRQTVLEDWTRDTADHGLGTVVLFSGPPGTGKTLSARAITSELGIPLVVVDLSRVVSKWVGETEKHLDACFAEAEASGVALLFDEADALFSKRSSKGDSASDRHANLEVGFLLQRIEAFTGLCFLTTNLAHGIDAAFQRRISVHVHFDLPDVAERAALWRLQLGEHLPVDDSIDVDALAEDFEDVSGADIRAAVLQAAYIAAGTGAVVSHELLVACASRTLLGRGALVRSVPHPLEPRDEAT